MYPTARPASPVAPRPLSVDAETPVDVGCLKEFRSEHFPESGPLPWLDAPDAEAKIARRLRDGSVSAGEAAWSRKWVDDGYVIFDGLFSPAELDAAWGAYEAAIASKRIALKPELAAETDPHPGRWLNPHFLVPEIDAVLRHPRLMRIANVLLGRTPIAFQTITSHKGSEQGEHSDSVHMTTYPWGYLVACWIAFEDIHPDSGPLIYYPGSHRAPFVSSSSVGITLEEFRATKYVSYHQKYEPAIREVIGRHGYPARHFHAKKGDVLFWHSNLIHGGSKRNDLRHSRHALVNHYFAEGCFCYHDVSGTMSWVHGGVEDLPVCGAMGTSQPPPARHPLLTRLPMLGKAWDGLTTRVPLARTVLHHARRLRGG